jgi:hypothetical protein
MSKTWLTTFKLIRKLHNKKVFDLYKKTELKTRDALLIGSKESGIEILSKQMILSFLINEKSPAILAIPENWNILPTISTPQLVIIYKSENKRSGNYQMTIPHFEGNKNFVAPEYLKGSYSVSYVLLDNSKILINAASFNEGERVIQKVLPFVNLKFRQGKFKYTKRTGIKTQKMKPVRADFFSLGRQNANHPNWSIYFN